MFSLFPCPHQCICHHLPWASGTSFIPSQRDLIDWQALAFQLTKKLPLHQAAPASRHLPWPLPITCTSQLKTSQGEQGPVQTRPTKVFLQPTHSFWLLLLPAPETPLRLSNKQSCGLWFSSQCQKRTRWFTLYKLNAFLLHWKKCIQGHWEDKAEWNTALPWGFQEKKEASTEMYETIESPTINKNHNSCCLFSISHMLLFKSPV